MKIIWTKSNNNGKRNSSFISTFKNEEIFINEKFKVANKTLKLKNYLRWQPQNVSIKFITQWLLKMEKFQEKMSNKNPLSIWSSFFLSMSTFYWNRLKQQPRHCQEMLYFVKLQKSILFFINVHDITLKITINFHFMKNVNRILIYRLFAMSFQVHFKLLATISCAVNLPNMLSWKYIIYFFNPTQ